MLQAYLHHFPQKCKKSELRKKLLKHSLDKGKNAMSSKKLVLGRKNSAMASPPGKDQKHQITVTSLGLDIRA
jgi:hypothetical protein